MRNLRWVGKGSWKVPLAEVRCGVFTYDWRIRSRSGTVWWVSGLEHWIPGDRCRDWTGPPLQKHRCHQDHVDLRDLLQPRRDHLPGRTVLRKFTDPVAARTDVGAPEVGAPPGAPPVPEEETSVSLSLTREEGE